KAWAMAGSDPDTVVWLNKADDPMRTATGHAVAARLKTHRDEIEAHMARQHSQDRPRPDIHRDLADRQSPWPGRVVIASLADADPVREVVIL
ncbi:MAG: hypothetical protein AB1Z38_10230, partial [Desulfotignum sp.]